MKPTWQAEHIAWNTARPPSTVKSLATVCPIPEKSIGAGDPPGVVVVVVGGTVVVVVVVVVVECPA
jgi:hypothetical protein